MKKKKAATKERRWKKLAEQIFWTVGKETFVCEILPRACPTCGAIGALVGLPRPILKKQPDATNVVCHPGLGGCNGGFHLDGILVLYRQLL